MNTRIIKLDPDFPDLSFVKESADVLRRGGLVVFPTETVYGIGANYLDRVAIDRLYRVKNRPRTKPFTIHIADFDALKEQAVELSPRQARLVNKFWPGPLTVLVFNVKGEKLGFRMPRNKIAIELIRDAKVPVVAPSANLSGDRPARSIGELTMQLKGAVDIIIDSGPTEFGIESTVVDTTKEPYEVVREGVISKKEVLADYHILFVCTGNSCRSVMAKAMLEKYLKEIGFSDKVWVDSAGTGTYTGIYAAPNTIEVIKEEGIDVSDHKGKSISPELLRKSDFIYIMEHIHRKMILNMLPEADSKIRLLNEEEDIPDPIGKPLVEYRRVKDIIKDKVEDIFLELFEKEKKS